MSKKPAAPRGGARSGQIVDPKGTPLGIGDPLTSSLLSLGFPAAGIGAAHLCTLVFGKLRAVIRRLRGIQPE